ncbi:MAG: putative Ig domain-containing protein [Mucilaginibacter sp.]
MKKLFTLTLLMAAFAIASAQDVPVNKGWKFSIGDSPEWSDPTFNDQNWEPISIAKSWEAQGHSDYDGFGWYRLHVTIPSSLKENAFFKDSIRFKLGMGDDGYAIYLNGQLIGKNYEGDDIRKGLYGECKAVIRTNDPAIRWNKDNVIAVRIFDTGGLGGLYGNPDNFRISMVDIMDYAWVNIDGDFSYDDNAISKTVKLETNSRYTYSGKLQLKVTDPETGAVIHEATTDASFAKGKPFSYHYTLNDLKQRSYKISYSFKDDRSNKKLTGTEGTPYVLTPYPGAKPRINGADVYGERPGNPFLFKIPATGAKPLTFKVDNLPEGLKLDAATGIITGVVTQKGDYPVTITVSNSRGMAHKKFTIKIGDLIGLTPALGWNSWNAFGLSVNDARVRVAAKTISDKLSAHGWAYVNIDDGWEAPKRAADGSIVTNQKFPDMKALSDYIHSLGLKFGIYSSPGPLTCGGYLGSYQHEDQDAQTYASWGVDYLKYDWCSYGDIAPKKPSLDDFKKPYQVMRASLDKVNRDILFSFCQYGMGDSWNWAGETGGNSWRTTGDITDTWRSMSDIGFHQQAEAPHARPGHFNDPDMLIVGKVGWGDNQHKTRLTPDEQYTHISLWSLLASPLLIGCDLGHLDRFTLNLLTNDEVLAINQDDLGKEAVQVEAKDGYLVYVKDLHDGSKAVGIFNISDDYKNITLNWSDLGLGGYTKVRDVWRQKYLITDNKTFKTGIPSHGVTLVKLSR